MIHNNHPVFASMPLESLADRMAKPGIVYDLWNHFARNSILMPEGRIYVPLGNHGTGPAAS